MHTVQQLPEGYREIFSVNLQKDKKAALWINLAAIAVMVILGLAGHACVSILTLFDMSNGLGPYTLRFAALLLGLVAYVVLHELTHAAVMKHYGAKKLRFGFTGLYAYAGSEQDYFDKHAYLRVALAPLVVWGVIFAVLCLLVPRMWFWIVWFLQIANVSGAAGDVYVSLKFGKMPADLLVKDTGIAMTVYSREDA